MVRTIKCVVRRAGNIDGKVQERSLIPETGIPVDGRAVAGVARAFAGLSQGCEIEICFHVLAVWSDDLDGGVIGFNFRGVVFEVHTCAN